MSCETFVGNPVFKTVVDCGFSVGVFASYVPQIVLVYRRRDTEGLNPLFLLLMNLGSSSAFFNIWLLSKTRFECCSTISSYDCFASLLIFLQLFCGFLGPSLLLVLAVKFREKGLNSQRILRAGQAMLAYDVVITLLVLVFYRTGYREQFATIMGLTSIAAGFVQYIPQIMTTYKLKHVGSLSVATLLIQIPGGYFWCLSLALSRDSRWSTWMPLFFASSSQAVLLMLAFYFMYKNRGTPKNPDGDYEEVIPPVDLETVSPDPVASPTLHLDVDQDLHQRHN